MKFSFALLVFLGMSSEVFGNCLLNESIEYHGRAKSEIEMSRSSDRTVTIIVELSLAPEAPSSVLPNPSDYDLNIREEQLRYDYDLRAAKIKYAQSFYKLSLNDLKKIVGLRVPEVSTTGVFLVAGQYEAICKATYLPSLISLSL